MVVVGASDVEAAGWDAGALPLCVIAIDTSNGRIIKSEKLC